MNDMTEEEKSKSAKSSEPEVRGKCKRLTLCSTIETCRHQVVVLPEPGGAVSSKVELGEDGDEHGSEDRRVDSDRQVTEAPAGDGGDELVETVSGEEAVSKVERKRNGETDDDGDGDDEVGRSRSVHVLGESSPSDSLRVERLNLWLKIFSHQLKLSIRFRKLRDRTC